MDVNAFSGRYGVVLRFDVNDGGEMLRKQKVQKEIKEVSGQENLGEHEVRPLVVIAVMFTAT